MPYLGVQCLFIAGSTLGEVDRTIVKAGHEVRRNRFTDISGLDGKWLTCLNSPQN